MPGRFKSNKAASKAAEPIMARVNERDNSDKPPEIYSDLTFKQFVEGRWKVYADPAEHRTSADDCLSVADSLGPDGPCLGRI
jgi:hypothetical protein